MIRLIARIDTRNGFHIKTINCEGVQKIRPVQESINTYSSGKNCHDEILLFDSVASLYETTNWLLKLENKHFYCPIPLAIGGAISNPQQAIDTLHKGADKIIINTAALTNPNLLPLISDICGRQALILQIDSKIVDKTYKCFTHGGRELSNYSIKNWISSAQNNGVGEIHLTSIDSEGTNKCFPEDLAELAKSNTNLPLIISGGIRTAEQISMFKTKYGINSFSMSSMTNILNTSIQSLRLQLIDLGQEVRIL